MTRRIMDDQGDDELTAIAARWRATLAEDAPDPQATAAAHQDIAVLLDAIARLHLHLAALTPTAKVGMEGVRTCCERMRRYLTDPDNVIDYWAELDQFESTKKSGVSRQRRRYMAWDTGRCSSGSFARVYL